jgi:ATP-binding cassette subfamily B protein
MASPRLIIRSVITPESWARTRRVLATFQPYAWRHRRLVSGALGGILLGTLVRLAQPWPLKYLFDSVLIPAVRSGDVPSAPFPGRTLLIICAAILLIGVASSAAFYLERIMAASAGQRIATSLRRRLFSHLITLPLEWHRRARRGDLVNLLGRDIQHLKELLVDGFLTLVSSLIQVAAMVGIMIVLNPRLSLVCVALLPFVVFSTFQVSVAMRDVNRKQRHQEGALLSSAQDVLNAIPAVKVFGQEAFERRRFAQGNRRSLRQGLKLKRLEAMLSRRVELLLALGAGLFVWIGVREVWAGRMTAGDLLIFSSYLKGFQKPLRRLSRLATQMARATVCGERIQEVLDIPGEATIDGDADPHLLAWPAGECRGRVRFDDVSFAYGGGRTVLDHVSFDIPSGSKVAVVGPSGSGKSALLSLLSGLLTPTSGRMLVDDVDTTDLPIPVLRAQVTAVFQEAYLFHGQLRDNIRYGGGEDDAALSDALDRAHATRIVERLEGGLDGFVGDQGLTLSGGERQRLTIARALLCDAPIVLLDEPTTGLDTESAAVVLDALGALTDGRTTFWSTHHLEQTQTCTHTVYVSDRGVRVVDGPPVPEIGDRLEVEPC